MLSHPEFYELYLALKPKIRACRFNKAFVSSEGTRLYPEDGSEELWLPEFRCQSGVQFIAHFTGCLLNDAGFGDFMALRAVLEYCHELLAFKKSDGSVHVFASLHQPPKE